MRPTPTSYGSGLSQPGSCEIRDNIGSQSLCARCQANGQEFGNQNTASVTSTCLLRGPRHQSAQKRARMKETHSSIRSAVRRSKQFQIGPVSKEVRQYVCSRNMLSIGKSSQRESLSRLNETSTSELDSASVLSSSTMAKQKTWSTPDVKQDFCCSQHSSS